MGARTRGLKRWIGIGLCSVVLSSSLTCFHQTAAKAATVDLHTGAKSVVLMDEKTGQILYQKNMDEPLPPASMEKMMVEYITLEKIKSGELHWDDQVTVSKYAAHVGGSGQMLWAGEKISVKDLFYEMSIYSGNDAAVTLAERISGSERNFVDLMNKTAKTIGMSSATHFVNATGLAPTDIKVPYRPSWMKGETVATAHDLAILADTMLKNDPNITQFSSVTQKKLYSAKNSLMKNWNGMLEGFHDSESYQGLDGLKTGHTTQAGFCLTATAMRDGKRLISVVMHAPGNDRSKSFDVTRTLLNYGFDNFTTRMVLPAKSALKQTKTLKVRKGVSTSVPIVTAQGVQFVVNKNMKPGDIKQTITTTDPPKIVAPIKQGQVLGHITLTYNNTTKTVNLIAAKEVKKASWFTLLMRAIGHFFHDTFMSIVNGIKGIF